jgi:hypothetical protein
MKQPIAGVAPPMLEEVTAMTVWPSVAATGYGRWWGRLYANRFGVRLFGIPLTIGHLLALLSIPLILPIYFHMLVPRLPFVVFGKVNRSCRRYRLTNRRVVIEPGLGGPEFESVDLDRFDAIQIEVVAGQAWYHAGDLRLCRGETEILRLPGVPRPEPFRRACLKAHKAYVSVAEVLAQSSSD